jgi:biotin carboxylase
MIKKLAIIGASYLQLPLILRARGKGLETHVFAWEEGAVGRQHSDFFYPISITEKDRILEVCRDIRIDGIVSIASDLAIITVNYIAEQMGLTGNSMESTRLGTNKYLMRECLSARGLPCPWFYRVNDAGQAGGTFTYPRIVKPTDRSGSRGVTLVYEPEGLEPAVERALSESLAKEAIIEEYLVGREISVEMISWEGRHHLLTCTDKVTTGPPYFVELQHHQPASLPVELVNRIAEVTARALDALGVRNGASHSEIIIHENHSFSIVEIGARMGGDHIGARLVELSTGFDFVDAVIDIALGIPPNISISPNKCSGIYYITPEEGIVTAICDRTDQLPEIIQSNVYVKAGDRVISPVRESQHRSAYFIYLADRRLLISDPSNIIEIKTERPGK